MSEFLLGTQSWSFKGWVGPFYPSGTRPDEMLQWYARMFHTVEVDATFYATPAEPLLRTWRERVGDGFVFSLKLPQRFTHVQRLVGVADELEKFVSRVSQLENALGPILIQLPPDFTPTATNRDRFTEFVAGLAKGVRWAVEFRHPRWFVPEILDALVRRDIATALVDGRWVSRKTMFEIAERPTADFAYVRWMGVDRRFTDYSQPQADREVDLNAWAGVLKRLAGRVETVFGYFNNQFQGHSPHSAREMQQRLGLTPVIPETVHPQQELFEAR